MKTCVIFCAGDFDGLAEPIGDAYVIAADGGLCHCQALGVRPDAVLGDFDSLGHVPQGSHVFPVEKDDTDSMLAVRHGLDRGCRRFTVYGALDGPRLDHAVANFQTLQFLADHGAQGVLVGRSDMVTVLKDGILRFPPLEDGLISVFCSGAAAEGVSIRGFQYGLENGTLTPGFPLGVSNHFVGKKGEVSVKNGSLLIIYDRRAGFPE